MGEDEGQAVGLRRPGGRIAEQEGVVGMDDIGIEGLDRFLKLARIGTGSEKSLPLKCCTATTRTTSCSSRGCPSRRGATTSTRWPAASSWRLSRCTDSLTPPTMGR